MSNFGAENLGGGQSGGLTDAELRASDVGVQTQREGADIDVLVAEGTVSSAGTTTVITPTPGKRIRIYWVLVQPDPANFEGASPLVKVKFGGATGGFYTGYVYAHWQVKTGAVDEVVQVQTDAADTIAYTIHYVEVT